MEICVVLVSEELTDVVKMFAKAQVQVRVKRVSTQGKTALVIHDRSKNFTKTTILHPLLAGVSITFSIYRVLYK